ncbi:hypothetical protein BASA81_005751 [Batrachochytrium salamandrivorans]|nr:hypothetical protein BASA81_005751 [Batrachochytrium salamandrivorans]
MAGQQKEHHYEFGGPFGAVGIPIVLGITVPFLYFAGNGACVLTVNSILNNGLGSLQCVKDQVVLASPFPKREVFGYTLMWFLFQMFLERLLPGDKVEGTLLANGTKLKYNINGHLAYWVSLFVMLHAYPEFNAQTGNFVGFTRFPLETIYYEYFEFAKSAMWFSFGLSVYLYSKSFMERDSRQLACDTPYGVYNWFLGRELNPRDLGDFDWKEFCELRPGLIGWQIVNVGCAIAQYQLHGKVSTPMILVNLFQGMYVWDALYSEEAILTTMDITTDGFGFMLAFGDLAWVPFTYSLQARFLVDHSPEGLPNWFWVGVFLVKMLGFIIFRGANGEKDQFRRDPTHPSVKHIGYMETKRGRKLMTSGGWWAMARKINYTGDWLMGLAWCMTTGFQTPLTYFYSIYFFVLLVHRAMRDNEACEHKYGKEDWDKYKKAVPYVFIPKVI